MPRSIAPLVLVLVVASLGLSSRARAHPAVDAGVRAYDTADFEQAMALFEQAEAGDGLTTDDLVVLLEHRALAAHALGRSEDVTRALTQLASIRPDHVFSPRVPPPIVQAFAGLARAQASALGIRASATRADASVRIETQLEGDSGSVVRAVRLTTRETGQWRVSLVSALTLELAPDMALEFFATALGPGGAILASHGSEAEPLRLDAALASPVATASVSDDTWWHWLLAVGAVLVAGAVAVGVALALSPRETGLIQVPPPRVGG